MIKRFFAALYFLLISCVNHAQTKSLEIVQTNAGKVSGLMNATGDVHIFKGIPFAAPPIEALRWKAPAPVKAWDNIRKCDAFGPSPMQAKPVPFSMWSAEFLIPEKPISEDCLYLNVWTNAALANDKKPVLVWIYGGGFSSGGSGVPIYDGEAMAKKGIVFVSINYRVGIFGFFAHSALTKESPNNSSGNYGLLDQVAALKWVKENIAGFGGDPNNVTIAGQSAGSMSVNCLVASPLAKGLFNKAIAESGASFVASGLRGAATLKQAEADGEKTAAALNATTLDELRRLPATTLMKAPQTVRGPIVDGYVLPMPIAQLFNEGKSNKVALLTGWNENEGLLFGPVKNAKDYRKQLEQQYGNNAEKMLQYYPATNDDVAATAQLDLSRDIIFGVQNYTWANVASKQGETVYVYRFTRKVPATGEYVKYGAFHTGEVPYAYDNLQFVDRPWQPIDKQLANVMSNYWAHFIKTGNPNGANVPEWKAFTTPGKEVMYLGDDQHLQAMKDAAQLDLLYQLITTQ